MLEELRENESPLLNHGVIPVLSMHENAYYVFLVFTMKMQMMMSYTIMLMRVRVNV